MCCGLGNGGGRQTLIHLAPLGNVCPARMTHAMAVASGTRVEAGVSEAQLLMETHHGVSLFVHLLYYFDLGMHVVHDDMHSIANTVADVTNVAQRTGTQKFSTKRRRAEQASGRFEECAERKMPWFGINLEEQGSIDELARSLRLPTAWEDLKYVFAKKHRC